MFRVVRKETLKKYINMSRNSDLKFLNPYSIDRASVELAQ